MAKKLILHAILLCCMSVVTMASDPLPSSLSLFSRFFRSNRTLLQLIKDPCNSSSDCEEDEKCVRAVDSDSVLKTGCLKMKSVGEPCTTSIECVLRTPDTTCFMGRCRCPINRPSYDEVTQQCFSNSCLFGEKCPPGQLCLGIMCSEEKRMFCSEDFHCPSGSSSGYCYEGRCFVGKFFGQSCNFHHQCWQRDPNAKCQHDGKRSTCSCKRGFQYEESLDRCLEQTKEGDEEENIDEKIPSEHTSQTCSKRSPCPEGQNCIDGMCSSETSISETMTGGRTTMRTPLIVPISHRDSHDSRYYVLIAGALFMMMSLVAGVMGCIKRSREIEQLTERMSRTTPRSNIRATGRISRFNDSALTPQMNRNRGRGSNSLEAGRMPREEDAPPDYNSVVKSPPAFEEIFGNHVRKEII